MGFLQQDTNNIILDAVLTDEGRKRLASNDGSFRVVMFSLGDDEVDYNIIKKFGRNVGREKIEKNTPVFEALTNATLESRSRLITLSPYATVDNTAYYNVIASTRSSRQVTFSVDLRAKTLVDNTFTTFGNSSNKTQITTFATIQGRQSGLSKTVSVTLNKTS